MATAVSYPTYRRKLKISLMLCVPPDQHKREIVRRRSPAGKLVHRVAGMLDDHLNGLVPMLVDDVAQPILAEFLVAVTSELLGDAIAVKNRHVAWTQLDCFLIVRKYRENSQHDSAAAQFLNRAIGANNQRRIMPGVAVGKRAR